MNQPTKDSNTTRRMLGAGIIRSLIATRRRLIIVFVGIVLIGGAAVWFFGLRSNQQAEPEVAKDNPYLQSALKLEHQPVPRDPLDKAIYYSRIAENYETLNQNEQALRFYLKAQAVIDGNNLADTIAFYRSIGGVYAHQHKNSKAKEYYQKEITRLKNYKKAHPDDPGTDTVIADVQKEIDKL